MTVQNLLLPLAKFIDSENTWSIRHSIHGVSEVFQSTFKNLRLYRALCPWFEIYIAHLIFHINGTVCGLSPLFAKFLDSEFTWRICYFQITLTVLGFSVPLVNLAIQNSHDTFVSYYYNGLRHFDAYGVFVISNQLDCLRLFRVLCQIPWFRICMSYSLILINWTVWGFYVSLANSVIHMAQSHFHFTWTHWGLSVLFGAILDLNFT